MAILTCSFLLAGRVLLIFLFLGFILQGTWSIARVFVSILGLCACGMVAVGFKARWSAIFLVLVLSVFNVFVNNWWSVHSAHPTRDFLKYDFFQTLCKFTPLVNLNARLMLCIAIVGGLILLVNMGPGTYNNLHGQRVKLTHNLPRRSVRRREEEDILDMSWRVVGGRPVYLMKTRAVRTWVCIITCTQLFSGSDSILHVPPVLQ